MYKWCTLHNTNLWFLFSLATGSTGESIQGIPGSKGDDGKPGLPGIPGPRGQSGEIGPAGICDSSGGCHRAPQQTGKLSENINWDEAKLVFN